MPIFGDKCQEIKVEEGQTDVNLENLQPFSEYEITVQGGLPSFEGEVEASRTIRTCEQTVDFQVSFYKSFNFSAQK